MTDDHEPGEFEIIGRFFAPLSAEEPGAAGLLDDAALLTAGPGRDLAVSTDTVVEAVHFLSGEEPERVAARLLAVGFSDIAATGAEATAYTLSLSIPRAWPGNEVAAWIGRFAAGLEATQDRFGVALVGGDTVVAPGPLSLTITAFGEIECGRALRRSGAKAGDTVWVSGTIGDGALGLLALRGGVPGLSAGEAESLVDRFRQPTARLALGSALVGIASAAADVSDGLVADLGHICAASGVVATIEAERIPLSPAARAATESDPALWQSILTGGDDYELVFTAPNGAAQSIGRAAAGAGIGVTAIGRVETRDRCAGDGPVRVLGPNGHVLELKRGGFTHI